MYKVAVAGSCSLSVALFEAVYNHPDFNIEFVLTAPPKPAGRGKKLRPTELTQAAVEKKVDVVFVDTFKKKSPSEFAAFDIEELKNTDKKLKFPPILSNAQIKKVVDFTKLDFVFVFSFGKLIPNRFLNAVKFGWFNWHPSPLPLLRGATPIETSILQGFDRSELCVFKMVKELDAGDILYRKEFDILPYWTALDLRVKIQELTKDTFEEVAECLKGYSKGKFDLKPQIGEPTFCYKYVKEDAYLRFEDAAQDERIIRAFYGSLWARTNYKGKLLKVLKAVALKEVEGITEKSSEPGRVIAADKKRGLIVACKRGFLKFMEVLPEGKKALKSLDFINGYRVQVGDKFESFRSRD